MDQYRLDEYSLDSYHLGKQQLDNIANAITSFPFSSLGLAIQNNLAPTLLGFSQALEDVVLPLRRQLEMNLPKIATSLQDLTTIAKVEETAERLGDHQFVLIDRIPKELVKRAQDENIDELADEFLIGDRYVETAAKYCDADRNILFRQAIQTIDEGLYNLAITGLIAILDRTLAEESGQIRNVNFNSRFKAIKAIVDARGEEYLDELEGKDYLLFISYSRAMSTIAKDIKFDQSEPEGVNRHWLMHGRTNREFTRLDCVKVLNLIYGTKRLGELGREDGGNSEAAETPISGNYDSKSIENSIKKK